MEINLKNIEEQIFFDKKIHVLLPEFRHYFDQWQLSKLYPGFGNLGQRSVVDLLNSIEAKQLRVLEEYFGCSILLNKIDPHIIQNYQNHMDLVNPCDFSGYKEFCITRNKDNQVKMTLWR